MSRETIYGMENHKGHTSFKMIYEHYYKYMQQDDPSDKIWSYFEPDETKNPEKWSQSGLTDQDVL